jgi:hypothetical protein
MIGRNKHEAEIAVIWDALYEKLWTFRDSAVDDAAIFIPSKCGVGGTLKFGDFYELRADVDYEYKIGDGLVSVMYMRVHDGVILSFRRGLK